MQLYGFHGCAVQLVLSEQIEAFLKSFGANPTLYVQKQELGVIAIDRAIEAVPKSKNKRTELRALGKLNRHFKPFLLTGRAFLL